MGRISSTNKRRRWKMERASVRRKRIKRARSNKFSGGDTTRRPPTHTQKRTWVGGYRRKDGTSIKGYFRINRYFRRT